MREKTGLPMDPYFSATKLRWLLDNVPDAQRRAENGELACGTVDSWLMWNFTNKLVHATDTTNASTTMLFNINTLEWDSELLDLFDIPRSLLPEVRSASEIYGYVAGDLSAGQPIPIAGVAGDQQASTFGQACFAPGDTKNTYGTGCFFVTNTGSRRVDSSAGLVPMVGWTLNGETTYALEGAIFSAGATVQWLRDELGIISSSAESESVAAEVEDNGGVYFVPAFSGLGTPYWDMYARGTIVGLTRGANRSHVTRAALESIAYQTRDLMDAVIQDTGVALDSVRVDGGATNNELLMKFQADILGIPGASLDREGCHIARRGLAGRSGSRLLGRNRPACRFVERGQDIRAVYVGHGQSAPVRTVAEGGGEIEGVGDLVFQHLRIGGLSTLTLALSQRERG